MINFITLLLIYIGIYSILSLSLNLIAGYTGLLSLCHAAFFAIGAYTTGILSARFQFDFILLLLISGLIASFFGLLIGLPTLRLKGDYLAIATLGFGEIIRNVILNWDTLTNGPMGINGITIKKIFGFSVHHLVKWQYLIIVWLMVIITYLMLRRLIRSRIGRAFEAIREDEIAAEAMGINIQTYKILSFTIGSFFAGIAGNLWAVYNQSISVQSFDFMLSVTILCMIVLGGMGNQTGVILGAIIIVMISELPRLLGLSQIISPQFRQIFFGIALITLMIFRPQGILGRKKIDFSKVIRGIK